MSKICEEYYLTTHKRCRYKAKKLRQTDGKHVCLLHENSYVYINVPKKEPINQQHESNQQDIDPPIDPIDEANIDPPIDPIYQAHKQKAEAYINNILKKTQEAKDRIDIMMYRRFMDTEGW